MPKKKSSRDVDLAGFAARLKAARAATGLTQEQLQDLIGVKQVRQWEQAKSMPQGKNLTAVAEALGVSERHLVTGESDVVPDESDRAALYEVWKREGPLLFEEHEVLKAELAAGRWAERGLERDVEALTGILRGIRAGRKLAASRDSDRVDEEIQGTGLMPVPGKKKA